MILTLELEPGAHTSEAQLCELLDCGRTPLREALQRLTDQSLVKHTPGRGYSIAPLDVFDFVDAMDAMALVAGITASLAVEQLTDADLLKVEEALYRAERLAAEEDFTAVSEYDFEFHVGIVRPLGNRHLARFLTRLHRIVIRFASVSWGRGWRPETSLEEHRQILQALKSRDPVAAETKMRQHFVKAKARVLGFLDAAIM
jgi:DNA-binding GntR family transcriptional regulator